MPAGACAAVKDIGSDNKRLSFRLDGGLGGGLGLNFGLRTKAIRLAYGPARGSYSSRPVALYR